MPEVPRDLSRSLPASAVQMTFADERADRSATPSRPKPGGLPRQPEVAARCSCLRRRACDIPSTAPSALCRCPRAPSTSNGIDEFMGCPPFRCAPRSISLRPGAAAARRESPPVAPAARDQLPPASSGSRAWFRVNRRHDSVRLCRQEREQFVLALDGRALRTWDAAPPRPDAREPEQGSIFAQCEPNRRFARLGVREFAERGCGDDAAAALAQPSAPIRALHVPNIRDRRAAELKWTWRPPTRHDEFALAVNPNSNDGRRLIRDDRRQERQISGAIMFRGEEVADRRLALGHAVQVAHRGGLWRRSSGRNRGGDVRVATSSARAC